MRNPLPHLHRDRHGTYYFRWTVAGHTSKKSLRTKDLGLATIRVACLNLELRQMPPRNEPTVTDILKAHAEGRTRKLDVLLPSGVELRGINNEDDQRRALELIGRLPREAFVSAAPTGAALPEHAHHKGAKFATVANEYLEELREAGLEETKGIEDKEKTYIAFAEEFENPRIGSVTKEMVSTFKSIALRTGGASRVNKKIGHLSVLFQWAIDNGKSFANPAEKMRIGTKAQQGRKVQHYEPFTTEDLRKIFSPKTWAAYATKPHFHWLPFLLLHTGARPEEIASIRLDEVRREKVGREPL